MMEVDWTYVGHGETDALVDQRPIEAWVAFV